MSLIIEQIKEKIRLKLSEKKAQEQEIIIKWLLGQESEKLKELSAKELQIIEKGINFRLQILEKYYLQNNPNQNYNNLIRRLASIMQIREKIRIWLSQSRDRQRAVMDVIQEVIQEMLKSDRYIQQQIHWIGECTNNNRIRNLLMLVTIEEYCLRPIRNQPLILYRFFNFLRHHEKGGLTQVPPHHLINLISPEINNEDQESQLSLFDLQAIEDYDSEKEWQDSQFLRQQVQEELELYLGEKIGEEAVKWFKLYLQGYSQESIGEKMNLPIKQVYRLREKITYHTIKGFSIKNKPELVTNWLQISLLEHNFGLTKEKWDKFYTQLTPDQKSIIQYIKEGEKIEMILKKINLTKSKYITEWTNIYLLAQKERNN